MSSQVRRGASLLDSQGVELVEALYDEIAALADVMLAAGASQPLSHGASTRSSGWLQTDDQP